MSTEAPSTSHTSVPAGVAEDPVADTDPGADGADPVGGDAAVAETDPTGPAVAAADAADSDASRPGGNGASAAEPAGVSAAEPATDPAGVSAGEPADHADSAERGDSAATDVSLLVREGDIAADYLEQFLDIVDYDGDIDLDVENGRAIVAVVGSDLHPLVGAGGTTLDALQELTRLAVQQQTGVRSRLMLDISGHRSQRRKQLAELAQATAQAVVQDGEPVRLAPMNPFERKVVHDAISALEGVRSESEGDEPQRRVVVHPER